MSPKKLVSGDDVLARQMKDPAFRAERDATSLARAVAIVGLSGCRANHAQQESCCEPSQYKRSHRASPCVYRKRRPF